MLTLPTQPGGVRVLGIDPGTTTLGFSLISTYDDYAVVEKAYTHKAHDRHRDYLDVAKEHGEWFSRLMQHVTEFEDLLNTYRPQFVVSESPFLGRFPKSFERLVQCLLVLRIKLFEKDPNNTLYTIDPVSVKKKLGISLGRGKSDERKSKELVATCVFNRQYLRWPDTINRDELDEHSTDATAVGLYFIEKHGLIRGVS